MTENRTVLSTTSGIVGAKAAVLVNEVTDQGADAVLSFGKNIGRSRLATKVSTVASGVKASASARIAEAGTDEAKAAREAKVASVKANAHVLGGKLGAFGKKVGSKIPISVEITEGIKNDVGHIKGQFAEINSSAAAYAELDMCTAHVTYGCDHKGVINSPVDTIGEDISIAGDSLCPACESAGADMISELAEEGCDCVHCVAVFGSSNEEDVAAQVASLHVELPE